MLRATKHRTSFLRGERRSETGNDRRFFAVLRMTGFWEGCAARTAGCALAVAGAFFATAGTAHATDPDTFSPVVSYQYLDSLDEPGSQTTVTSPVVSYQYFDWPGDENLTFTNSPSVSFFYNDGVSLTITGRLQTSAGVGVAGATIILKRQGTVFWQGVSDATGYFTTPNLGTLNYTMTVTKAGYVTLVTNLVGSSVGLRKVNIKFDALPSPPQTVAVDGAPAASAIRPPASTDTSDPNAARLKLFDGTQFVDAPATLDSTRMTVVITHGWKSSPNDWATTLAFLIRNHSTQSPNIVAWDWHNQASAAAMPIPQTDPATEQGLLLGSALQQRLGTGYSHHVHFIGHSLGTIVNAYACDYVHGSFSRASMNPPATWSSQQTTPHMTLLDEAELASVANQNVITSSAIGWEAAQLEGALVAGATTAAANWRSPIPHSAWWIDNYISACGIRHPEAVNVCLLAGALSLQNQTLQSYVQGIESAHGYSHLWYSNTVTSSPAIGYGSSLESGATFPPSGTGTSSGNLWWENIDTPDPSDISQTRPNLGGLVDATFTGDCPALVIAGALAGDGLFTKPLDALGQSVLNGYQSTIQWAGNIGGDTIYTTGQVISSTTQKVGLWWDAASDQAANVLNSINPETQLVGPLAAPVFKISLQTQPSVQPLTQTVGKLAQSSAAPSTVGQPAYAWITLNVPADAGLMAFDFTVTGDPQEDRIACAINDQNVFTLPAKFAPDGQPVSTDMFDVSAYAGQSVELFFGLTGGTSTNCQVAIDGVRFITIPQPKLALGTTGSNAVLKWPAAASGWILETSTSLAPGSWQTVPTDSGVTIGSGVATLEQLIVDQKRFYRLRKAQ